MAWGKEIRYYGNQSMVQPANDVTYAETISTATAMMKARALIAVCRGSCMNRDKKNFELKYLSFSQAQTVALNGTQNVTRSFTRRVGDRSSENPFRLVLQLLM